MKELAWSVSKQRRRLVQALAAAALVPACRSTPIERPERGPFAAALAGGAQSGATRSVLQGLEQLRDTLPVELIQHAALDANERQAFATLREWAQARVGMIIVHGDTLVPIAHRVAWEFPRQRFTVLQGEARRPNVGAYVARHEHASWLAGIAAGLLTRSNVVGHLSAADDAEGLLARAAFADGMARINRQARLLTSTRAGHDDIDLAGRIAQAQIDAGADIVYAMLDRAREGVSRACTARRVRQIGTGSDWVVVDPQLFVASVRIDLAAMVRSMGRDIVDAVWRGDYVRYFDIRHPDVVTLHLAASVPATVREALDDWRRQLAARRIVIPREYRGPTFEPA